MNPSSKILDRPLLQITSIIFLWPLYVIEGPLYFCPVVSIFLLQAWCCLQVKLCDPCLSTVCTLVQKALYKYSSFPFLPLWSPYVIGQTIIFLPCGFYLSSFFFSLPNLSGLRLDVYHTSTHGVALVRIQNACLKCAARGSLKIQDAKIAILAPSDNFARLYL